MTRTCTKCTFFLLLVFYVQDPHAPNNGFSKSKLAKDKPNLKGITQIPRNQRAILSQSLSFPSRGSRGDPMKKSIDANPVKAVAKHARGNATKAEAHFSVSRLNPNRRASTGVYSKEENTTGGASLKRTSLAAIPSIRCSSVRLFRYVASTFYPS